jgi:hypothetical protein
MATNRSDNKFGPLTVAAVAAGTWKESDTLLSVANAGKVHEVLVSFVQPEVARVAVAPAGSPVTVREVMVGNAFPLVGVMAIVYVAVPPGGTVCDEPLPLPLPPPPGAPTPKLMTLSERALLDDTAKLGSPL